MTISIPANAQFVMRQLHQNGFEAFVVGGCVRDALCGLTPHDWDICTNALPEQIKGCFAGQKTFDTGIKHGTISVVIDGEVFEVTTYRIDGEYTDNRHPESVTFTDNITPDLSRRDFTVNAMAYNTEKGLVDPFGGADDLQNNCLRCVGNPDTRFQEDALRILRGLRFAATYGFEFEKHTATSILQNSSLLNHIAAERVSVELNKLLCGKNAEAVLNDYRAVIAVVIPEITATFDYPQHTKHHVYDVWRHITKSVGNIPPNEVLRMTMLLHDIGKPRCHTTDPDGTDHFKGHQQVSAESARQIFSRLRYSNEFSQTCLDLILYHDIRFDGSQKQVKRVLNRLGADKTKMLFQVQRADICAQSDYRREQKLSAVDTAERQMEQILAEGQCFSLGDLAIDGNDLKRAGISEGKQIGLILNALLSEVIDEKLTNDKQTLLQYAIKKAGRSR